MIIKETEAEYNAGRKGDWISPSDIKGKKTPFQFHWYKKFHVPEPKTYFNVGTAFHTAMLEPQKFDKEVTYFPEKSFPDQKTKNADGTIPVRTNANKEAFKNFQEQNPGKTVLREKDWNVVSSMVQSARAYPGTPRLLQLNQAYIECSFYTMFIWNQDGSFDRIEPCDKDFKRESDLTILVRTKADFVHKVRGYGMDVKTAVNVDPDTFAKDCANLEYDIQGAMVCNIAAANLGNMMVDTFVVLAVEKTPPYQAVIYDIKTQDLFDAAEVYIRRLNAIREAINAGKFAGYEYLADNEYGLITLQMPGWYKQKQFNSKF